MFKLFSKYSFFAYAILPIVLLIFRIPLFISPETSLTSYDEDLYTPLWDLLFGSIMDSSVWSIACALIVNFITILLVNHITNNYCFTERQSHLGGFFFMVLSSGFVISQGFHPVSIFVLLFAIALIRIFSGAQNEKPMRNCYDVALLFSIASLLWAKGVWFFPFHIIMLIMLRIFTLRTLLATLFGIMTPVILVVSYYFFDGTLQSVVVDYLRCIVVPVAFYKTSVLAKIYLGIMALALLLSMLHTINKMQTQKILESRYSRIMIWSVFYSVVLLMLPHFSFEVQNIIAVCGAIIISSFLQSIRSGLLAEIITLILVVLSWSVQWWS